MTTDLREKWDSRYRDADGLPAAARVLADNVHLLPASGRALDLACGLGANALLLAERGLRTWAWDLSPVAVERLQGVARARGLTVEAEVRDVQREPPQPETFDVVVVSHFLDRQLAPALMAALRPGGLLFYQTFTRARVEDTGPASAEFRLGQNELLRLFADLTLVAYREESRIGDLERGFRNEALLIGRRLPRPGANP
jgi:tellurite methyltransferase